MNNMLQQLDLSNLLMYAINDATINADSSHHGFLLVCPMVLVSQMVF